MEKIIKYAKINMLVFFFTILVISNISCQKDDIVYSGVVVDSDCGISCKIKLLNNITITDNSGRYVDSFVYSNSTISANLKIVGKRLQFDLKDSEQNGFCPADILRIFKEVNNVTEMN